MNVDQGYTSHVRTKAESTERTCLTVVHLSVEKQCIALLTYLAEIKSRCLL